MDTKSDKYESGGDSDRTYQKTNKRKNKVELQREVRKIKPPTFDCERVEDVEAWILSMTKYF